MVEEDVGGCSLGMKMLVLAALMRWLELLLKEMMCGVGFVGLLKFGESCSSGFVGIPGIRLHCATRRKVRSIWIQRMKWSYQGRLV